MKASHTSESGKDRYHRVIDLCAHLCCDDCAMANQVCVHLAAIASVKHAKRYVCEECIKTGDTWVHLRTCQTCGVTLCCDSSPNRHAHKQAHASKHPVIASAEPGERWLYCYPDDQTASY